jgi:8-oxo-dGTP diphosphatase
MFLFDCKRSIDALPPAMDEGHFAFFSREAIEALPIPETDRTLLWPYYDKFRDRFVGLRANCDPGGELTLVEELRLP